MTFACLFVFSILSVPSVSVCPICILYFCSTMATVFGEIKLIHSARFNRAALITKQQLLKVNKARYRRQSALQKYNSEKRASNIALSYGVDVDR